MDLQSEKLDEFFSALSKAQGELQAAKKDSFNPFFKSTYSSLPAVMESCKDVLAKNNLSIVQSVSILDGKNVLITTLGHASGQWMRSISPIVVTKNDAQGFGTGMSYARRYALAAIVGIVTDDDDDGESAVGRPNPTLTDDQIQKIVDIIDGDQGLDEMLSNWLEKEKIGKIENIKQKDFPRVVKALNAKRGSSGAA